MAQPFLRASLPAAALACSGRRLAPDWLQLCAMARERERRSDCVRAQAGHSLLVVWARSTCTRAHSHHTGSSNEASADCLVPILRFHGFSCNRADLNTHFVAALESCQSWSDPELEPSLAATEQAASLAQVGHEIEFELAGDRILRAPFCLLAAASAQYPTDLPALGPS